MIVKFDLLKDLFISLVLSFLYEFFQSQLIVIENSTYKNLCAIFLAISCTSVLVLLCYYLYGKLPFFRYVLHPLGRFEGRWASSTGIPERPISIFEIRYDSINHCYIYFGYAYDRDGNYQGDWHSQGDLVVDNNKFRFYATGHFVDADGNLCSTESSGYVILKKHKSEYTGDGYTVDWCGNNNCFKTSSKKITRKFLWKELKCKKYNADTLKKLIDYYGEKNQFGAYNDVRPSQTDNMHHVYQNDILVFQRVADHEDYNNNLITYLEKLVNWKGKTVFEAGVGTGRILSSYVNDADYVYVSDRSQSMLDFIKLRFSKFAEKLHLINCDHVELDNIGAVHKCDVFISTYSFGHAYIDGVDPKETYEKLIGNCKSLVKKGGMIVIAENQSVMGSPLSYDAKLGEFFNSLISDGFNYNIIDTDYQFKNSDEAFSVMNAFFGSELGEKIKADDLTVIPEKTIVFHKVV